MPTLHWLSCGSGLSLIYKLTKYFGHHIFKDMLSVGKNKSMHTGRKLLKNPNTHNQIKCSELVANEERMTLKTLCNCMNLLCAHVFNTMQFHLLKTEKMKVQQKATAINKINPSAQKLANQSKTLQHGKADEHEKGL